MPTPQVRERIEAILQRDELYGEEFISNRQVLRELILVMLTQEDWETIAAVAADSLKVQIMHQASSLENLGDEINIKIVHQI